MDSHQTRFLDLLHHETADLVVVGRFAPRTADRNDLLSVSRNIKYKIACASCHCNNNRDYQLQSAETCTSKTGSSISLYSWMRRIIHFAIACGSSIIIRPHRSTTYMYVDAAYCYRPSSVVCRSVGLSVCRSVTLVSPAKKAEPIEMPFGLRTRVSPGNHVLDGGSDPPTEKGNFEGEGRPIVKYRDTLWSPVRKRLNRSRYRLGSGLGWAVGIVC